MGLGTGTGWLSVFYSIITLNHKRLMEIAGARRMFHGLYADWSLTVKMNLNMCTYRNES